MIETFEINKEMLIKKLIQKKINWKRDSSSKHLVKKKEININSPRILWLSKRKLYLCTISSMILWQRKLMYKKKQKLKKKSKEKEIKNLESMHSLLDEISIPYGVVVLTTRKDLEKIWREDIKNIIQQNNYTNKYLETIGQ